MQMLFLKRPSLQTLQQFRQIAEQDSFSYPELCATLHGPLPSGYSIDHNRVCLGWGENVFERAPSALPYRGPGSDGSLGPQSDNAASRLLASQAASAFVRLEV